MQLGIVKGSVTATIKHPIYEGEKLLLVEPVHPNQTKKSASIIAIDRSQAGPGDLVLYVDEGNSARTVLQNNIAPTRTVILGIVDEVSF